VVFQGDVLRESIRRREAKGERENANADQPFSIKMALRRIERDNGSSPPNSINVVRWPSEQPPGMIARDFRPWPTREAA
jgi:hypothetical protein